MHETASKHFPFLSFLGAGVFAVLLTPIFWYRVVVPRADAAGLSLSHYIDAVVVPSVRYTVSRLSRGELPLWQSGVGFGGSWIGERGIGLWEPLGAVLLWVPHPRAWALYDFLGLTLAAVLFFVTTTARGIPRMPAVLGGVVYTLSGVAVASLARPDLMPAFVLGPVLWWATERLLEQRSQYADVWLALLVGWLGIAGAWSIAGVWVGAIIARFVFDTVLVGESLRVRLRQGLRIAGALCVGLGISAVAWFPAVVLSPGRDGGILSLLDVRPGLAVPQSPRVMLQSLFAVFPQTPLLGYFGLIPLLLLPGGFFLRPCRKECIFWAAVLVIGYCGVLVDGSGGVYTGALYFPMTFGVARLTAYGAARLVHPLRDAYSPNFWVPAVMALAVGLWALYAASTILRALCVVAVAALLLHSMLRRNGTGILLSVVFIGFGVLDGLLIWGMGVGHPAVQEERSDVPLPPALRLAGELAGTQRIAFCDSDSAKRFASYLLPASPLRVANIPRYWATREVEAFWRRINGTADDASGGESAWVPIGPVEKPEYPQLLSYASVRVLATTPEHPLSREYYAERGVSLSPPRYAESLILYSNESALPRIYAVSSWRIAPSVEAALEMLQSKEFLPRAECIVEVAPSSGNFWQSPLYLPQGRVVDGSREAVAGAEGAVVTNAPQVVLETEREEYVALSVKAETPAVVVLTDLWDSGWHAWVNGVRVPLLRVNGLFRGVWVPAGEHRIEMRYRPWSYAGGLVISSAGLMWVSGAALRRWIASRVSARK